MVNTGLEPGYYDPVDQILYGCMNLMKHFVEGTEETIDREQSPNKQEWDDLLEIYDWWVNIRPKREEQEPEYPDLSEVAPEWELQIILGHEYDDHPTVQEWHRAAERHHELEKQWYYEDEEMLIRLMKLRPLLWYP